LRMGACAPARTVRSPPLSHHSGHRPGGNRTAQHQIEELRFGDHAAAVGRQSAVEEQLPEPQVARRGHQPGGVADVGQRGRALAPRGLAHAQRLGEPAPRQLVQRQACGLFEHALGHGVGGRVVENRLPGSASTLGLPCSRRSSRADGAR
jgi:hypothetical protein